jgi:nucleoside-diphosphate-sugar epimerase
LKALVTGASGFLGRSIVAELLKRGHHVRALIRPATDVERLPWRDEAELFFADLREHPELEAAFEDIDVLLHLAAVVKSAGEPQFAGTVVGTERLLHAMQSSQTRRIILASSFSVYDWLKTRRVMSERAQLESNLYERDEYAIAKTWQENLVRRAALENGWQMTILRPGFLWGAGEDWVHGAGLRLPGFLIVNGPFRRLPLTHVENCAHCFVAAAENEAAIGEVFNVVDTDRIRAWRYSSDYVRLSGERLRLIWVPYWFGYQLSVWTSRVCRWLLGKSARLPGVLSPIRHAARFRSFHFPNEKLRSQLGWEPPLSYEQCLRRTYESSSCHANERRLPARNAVRFSVPTVDV